jgi:hypothetical protein
MLAVEGALRKRFGDGGRAVLHMRSMGDEDHEQRHTMFPNNVNRYDAAGQPRTEIVTMVVSCVELSFD